MTGGYAAPRMLGSDIERHGVHGATHKCEFGPHDKITILAPTIGSMTLDCRLVCPDGAWLKPRPEPASFGFVASQPPSSLQKPSLGPP